MVLFSFCLCYIYVGSILCAANICARKEFKAAKGRKARQPAPIKVRKALDNLPVDAGQRAQAEVRLKQLQATRSEREARKEKRAQAAEARKERGNEEVDFQAALGGDFFGPDGIAP